MHQAQILTADRLPANTSSGSRAAHLLRAAWATWDRQRQRRALFDLDEHHLRDIGKTRVETLKEARKPFWK